MNQKFWLGFWSRTSWKSQDPAFSPCAYKEIIFQEGCNAKVFYVTKIILWHRSPDDWEVEELKLQQFNPANQTKIYYNFEPVKKNKAFSKFLQKSKFHEIFKNSILERNQKYEFIGHSLNMGFAKLITKTYLIEIKTADEMMAGTDANVTLCMSGTKGDTGKTRIILRKVFSDNLSV